MHTCATPATPLTQNPFETIATSLPVGPSRYCDGYRDALESLVLALQQAGVSAPTVHEAVLTALDALDNNTDEDECRVTPEQRQKTLREMQAQGMEISEVIEVLGVTEADNPIVAAAQGLSRDGEIEVPATTIVSEGQDGAYVLAWLFVGSDERDTEETQVEGDAA